MAQRYLGIIFGNLFHDLSPQPGGIQHIGLIHADHFLPALHGNVKCLNSYSPDLILVICKGVYGGHDAVHFLRTALSEIQAAGQFSHNNHVETVTDNLLL